MKQLDRPSSDFISSRRLPQALDPQLHAEFEAARPSISTTHYLLLIYRHKWRIIGFVALCLLLTYLISSRLTPVYEATAKIDVDLRVPAGVVGQEAAQNPPSEDADAFLATQTELIQYVILLFACPKFGPTPAARRRRPGLPSRMRAIARAWR